MWAPLSLNNTLPVWSTSLGFSLWQHPSVSGCALVNPKTRLDSPALWRQEETLTARTDPVGFGSVSSLPPTEPCQLLCYWQVSSGIWVDFPKIALAVTLNQHFSSDKCAVHKIHSVYVHQHEPPHYRVEQGWETCGQVPICLMLRSCYLILSHSVRFLTNASR